MTDADTIANAELLWKLVHLVQDVIRKDGELLDPDCNLLELRELADECDPDYGRS